MRWTLCLLIACGTANDGRPATSGAAAGTPTGLPVGTPTGTTTTTGTPTAPPAFQFDAEVLLDDLDRVQVGNIRQLDLGTGAVEVLESVVNPPTLHRITCEADCAISEIPVPPGVLPTRTAAADLDEDGDQDLILASIGVLGPTNDLVGSLWVLWADSTGYVPEEIASGLPRTVCAEPGDLDGDGDLDLTLCLFGHATVGELDWLEQQGGTWRSHTLDPRPGAIHAFPADLDGDGDLDIVAPMSQLTEEIVVHWNDGAGSFTAETVFQGPDTWFGLSGVELSDLDQDGDLDILFTNGDTMDVDLPQAVDPNVYHALHWLRNDGVMGFTHVELHQGWGAYAIRTADLDGDGATDIVLGNFINTHVLSGWQVPAEITILHNDGDERFTAYEVQGAARQMLTLELADADADGDLDIFTGSMRVDPNQTDTRLVLLRNTTGE